MITLREVTFPKDAEQIVSMDVSFTTDTIYTAYRDGDHMELRLTALQSPLTKRFPLDDLDKQERAWEFAMVATVEGRICGLLAARYQAWNRRLTIPHLYVHRPQRRRGIARLLLDQAQVFGIEKNALNMWAETSSMNTSGVRAYRRLGFELCGFDTTLYHGTSASAETAIFLARPIIAGTPHSAPE
jgi:ribosomal protein S18 acetylase RimI-like enzyme